MVSSISYSANVQVFKTSIKTEKRINGRLYPDTPKEQKVVENFRVTVKAKTLESLKDKVKAHMDLIDGEDLGEDLGEGED